MSEKSQSEARGKQSSRCKGTRRQGPNCVKDHHSLVFRSCPLCARRGGKTSSSGCMSLPALAFRAPPRTRHHGQPPSVLPAAVWTDPVPEFRVFLLPRSTFLWYIQARAFCRGHFKTGTLVNQTGSARSRALVDTGCCPLPHRWFSLSDPSSQLVPPCRLALFTGRSETQTARRAHRHAGHTLCGRDPCAECGRHFTVPFAPAQPLVADRFLVDHS